MAYSSPAAVLPNGISWDDSVTPPEETCDVPLDLRAQGVLHPGRVHANRTAPALVELALARREGLLTDTGAFVAYTGSRTGRSPQDRFLVTEGANPSGIHWGAVNRPME